MVTEELFDAMVELYDNNVKLFKAQNTGFLVDRVFPLHKEDVEKVIDINGVVIDQKYIREHYRNFTVNPQIMNVREGYATQIDLMPDISWEFKK